MSVRSSSARGNCGRRLTLRQAQGRQLRARRDMTPSRFWVLTTGYSPSSPLLSPPFQPKDHSMKYTWLFFVAGAVLTWGAYVVTIDHGRSELAGVKQAGKPLIPPAIAAMRAFLFI